MSSICSAKATHIFSAKNIRILYFESAKTVNEMTLNELVKLATTGPRPFTMKQIQVDFCNRQQYVPGNKNWPWGAWAFSMDLTINLSPQCRAFSKALPTEKFKAPLFPGSVMAGTTNDWCINGHFCLETTLLESTFKLSYILNHIVMNQLIK